MRVAVPKGGEVAPRGWYVSGRWRRRYYPTHEGEGACSPGPNGEHAHAHVTSIPIAVHVTSTRVTCDEHSK